MIICANVTWTFTSSALFVFISIIFLLHHSQKIIKDRVIQRKIAFKRSAKLSSAQHTAENNEILHPSDTKGTKEMHHLT